jgi:hypothetical protein
VTSRVQSSFLVVQIHIIHYSSDLKFPSDIDGVVCNSVGQKLSNKSMILREVARESVDILHCCITNKQYCLTWLFRQDI